jgi:hypothetical protein
MPSDPAIKNHQAWIGYLQPDGLVVSAAALVDAQVFLDQNLLPLQQRFLPFIKEVSINESELSAVEDFPRFVREFLEWPDDCIVGLDPSSTLPDTLSVPLPEFGETLAPSFALKDAKPKEASHPWLILVKVLSLGEDLDASAAGKDAQWSASPSRRFERLLRETNVPIGVVSNGVQIRLIYAPRGENSGSITFPVEAMTEVAGRPILGALYMLLHRYRLFSAPSEARLPALLERSRAYQSRVSEELARQVLDSLYELLRGFQAADERAKGELLREVLAANPNDVYAGLLTVLLRLVFLLYAEDRGLMPNSSTYAQNYSVHGLFERLRADYERYPDTIDHRYGAWSQLVALFRAVYDGCRHPQMAMPARKGFLFDPDRYLFLEGRSKTTSQIPLVSDGVLFRVLRNLLILDGERLSYRTLDVEQIGSVYETMVGFRLEVANGPTIALKPAKSKGAPTAINLEELLAAKADERPKKLREKADQKLSGEAAERLKNAESLDDLLATLERKIARNATPDVVPKGGLLLQPSDERRRSGSHYTPRSLTEPIVRKTLEPILKRLGDRPTPEQILDLKICDIAVGSGAFLVEVSRQLGDELVKAWHNHNKLPYIPPDEDEVLHARRLVAQRCLYGVDRNPMAVDLAKLSLWLATLAKDHPFTFLDHSIRCGDSLVGLSRKQLADFHWRPEPVRVLGQDAIEQRIETASRFRKEILEADEFVSPVLKRQKLDLADESLEFVRLAGACVIAAFFAADNNKARLAKRTEYLDRFSEFFKTFDPSKNVKDIVDQLHSEPFPIRPFHWEIEFPEVFDRVNRGFDAIIGNPPFLGGKRISTTNGDAYRDYLSETWPMTTSNVDLCGYFHLRSRELLRKTGCYGLISTERILIGDSRIHCLNVMGRSGKFFDIIPKREWPGEASVTICVLHYSNESLRDSLPTFLEPAESEVPSILKANSGVSFVGCAVQGMGFTISTEEEMSLAKKCEQDVVRPFLTSEDLNSNVNGQPSRKIIFFAGMDYEEAKRYPTALAIIEQRVKPYRDSVKRKAHKKYWWRYGDWRPGLYDAIRNLDRTLVVGLTSKSLAFLFVPNRYVFDQTTVVIASSSFQMFSILSSRAHLEWSLVHGANLGGTPRYNPSRCFETFPFPENWEKSQALEQAGRKYYEFRAALMVRNNEGLTKTYNRFHDPEESSPDIIRLRELHATMDRAVLDAYGWTDIQPTCEFIRDYEEDDDEEESGRRRKKPWRYRWPDEIRDEVLARLLELNKQRAEEEALEGESVKSVKKNAKQKQRKPKPAPNSSQESLSLEENEKA